MSDNGIGYGASKYPFVPVKGVSGYTWLKLTAACTVTVTAEARLHWCAAMRGHAGAPSLCKRHRSTLQYRALELAAENLKTTHRFAEANSPWTHGTSENMTRKKMRTLEVLSNEGQCMLAD